jgi:hypothetical protein
VIGHVRTEGFAVRKTYPEACVVGKCSSVLCLASIFIQAHKNMSPGNVWVFPRWWHFDDLSVDQLSFACDFV